jgi:hypothetical protein
VFGIARFPLPAAARLRNARRTRCGDPGNGEQ